MDTTRHYIWILSLGSLLIGFSFRDEFQWYALLVMLMALLVLSIISLPKLRPDWVATPFEEVNEEDEVTYRFESWAQWKKNLRARSCKLVIGTFLGLFFGRFLLHFIVSPGGAFYPFERLIVSSLELVIFFILLFVFVIVIAFYLDDENKLRNKKLWKKKYLLQQFNEKKKRLKN